MPRLVKQDDALWANHLEAAGLHKGPGEPMVLWVDGTEVHFVPLKAGADGRQPPGWKARGIGEAFWNRIPKGTEVLLEAELVRARVFWVNQGVNFKKERDGGYVRAPKYNAQGVQIAHWKRVSELKPGDVLVHYQDGYVRALGRVTSEAMSIEEAWRAEVEYFPLRAPLFLAVIAEHLSAMQPSSGPFTSSGAVKQGYLWVFNAEGLAILRRISREPWPQWAEGPAQEVSIRRMVKIEPGEGSVLWDEFLRGGHAFVGWDEVGDLRRYDAFESFYKAFAGLPGMKRSPRGHIERKAKELWTLVTLRPGDKVLANRGTSEILAIGDVLEPGYEWQAERARFKHTVRVKWDNTQARSIPPQDYWVGTTIAEVPPGLQALIMASTQPRQGALPAQQAMGPALERSGPKSHATGIVDIAVLTARSNELVAVLDALDIPHEKEERTENGTVYFRGSLHSRRAGRNYHLVVTCIGGAGNYDASAATEGLISSHRPQVVILAGMAAGIREKVLIGEVVFSDRIVAYEPGAVVASDRGQPSHFERRPEIERLPHAMNQDVITYRPDASRLEARFRQLGKDFPSLPDEMGKALRDFIASAIVVSIRTIASGEKLLRDPEMLQTIRREQHGKVEVGEMEAAGFVAACRRANVPWLVIRGISDFGDQLKDDSFHDFAAYTAATVLADFLTHGLHLPAKAPHAKALLVPRYPDERTRHLSLQLEEARERRKRLQGSGADTSRLDEEILSLRRQLREGGQLRAGDLFGDGRYLLLEPIGRGGFGSIWKAQEKDTGEVVAIKVLHSNLAGDEERRERFFRGARRMAELQHPAVVRVIQQQGEDGGYHYFVMEYLPGGNLQQAVIGKTVTRDEVIPIIIRIAEALAFAHSRSIVHRDVKPANILLDAQKHPLLTDFDLVGAADTTGGTRTGALGTFIYAAPECQQRPQDADPRADVYSLGMTAIFGIHGDELPFKKILRTPERFVDELPCALPLKNVLRRAISDEPGERYENARAFMEALQEAEATREFSEELQRALDRNDDIGRVISPSELERLKGEARKLAEAEGEEATDLQALDQVAQREGFLSWWHLRRRAAPEGGAAKPEAPNLVRFSIDPKDADGIGPERLEAKGIESDEEFLDYLMQIAQDSGDEAWYELSAWEVVFRFSHWRSSDVAEIVKRVREVFFFPPRRIWVGGKELELSKFGDDDMLIIKGN